MTFTKKQINDLLKALRALPIDAPTQRVEDFAETVLHLSAVDKLEYFPSPDNQGLTAITVGQLTETRESILRDKVAIPEFAVYQDPAKNWVVSGLLTYLHLKGAKNELLDRLKHHKDIRKALVTLKRGHDLEVLGAAILEKLCSYGEATRGSGDQGIDAIGKKELMSIDPAFHAGGIGSFNVAEPHPGDNVFILVSSKATISPESSNQALINPAHIRELVGAWLIQRDDVGKWREIGIRMLSPIQLILITTYRLSDDSTNECRKLGIQVWGIPQLIYLICFTAPPEVFDASNDYSFSKVAFREWWKAKDITRVKP
jgi:hypothetical protein